MDDQEGVPKGGTMRLGAYACDLEEESLARELYGDDLIDERHRHRYEFNNAYRQAFGDSEMRLSGINPERDLVEIVELPGHPFFMGVQFHPEFKSSPLKPQPVFSGFVRAAKGQMTDTVPRSSAPASGADDGASGGDADAPPAPRADSERRTTSLT